MSALDGQVAVITGAASGMGRAMARRFAAEGARLVLADLQTEKLEKVAGELAEAGHEVAYEVVDVSEAADVERLIGRAQSDFGGVDTLCNNAGILDNLTPLHDTDEALWDRLLGVNAKGPFLASRLAVKLMMDQGGGSIINTASAAGNHGGRGGAAYTASKHAVVGLTKSIAWFYGPHNIRCNAICPGAIMTAMASSFTPHTEGFERYSKHFPTVPPFGKARDIADVAVFLASDEARYVNGAVIPVDGGWVAY
ncbi:MAG: glucose 1-dehydrogenase [Myxococcota bacterium]|nr:glucose 1-dehydrogenase [Myxococcota bacterium]